MSFRRLTAEALSQILNWDGVVEEKISETKDFSGIEDNIIDDPDHSFSSDEEDSEDTSAVVSPSDYNQDMQQSSSKEGRI